MISVIDYGMGNLGSILNMMKRLGAEAKIVATPDDIMRSDKLILPGVGSFDHGMRNLEERGLRSAMEECVIREGKPILGICLGMQLMTASSEEGELPGLGWVDAVTRKFRFDDKNMKVPHMGWNSVNVRCTDGLFKGIDPEPRFYFVHSYYVECGRQAEVLATTRYGIDFVSSFQRNNVMGVQFHPEKSHRFGMKLLKRFVEQAPE
jgi:glutamine amidotransferase